jgi:hypothetical protein
MTGRPSLKAERPPFLSLPPEVLNRFGASAVYTAELVIDLWLSHPWIARVSWPLLSVAAASAPDPAAPPVDEAGSPR